MVCGDGSGTLDIYSWGLWGDLSDRFPGHPDSIDSICKITEDILCTGCADGTIRYVIRAFKNLRRPLFNVRVGISNLAKRLVCTLNVLTCIQLASPTNCHKIIDSV